MLGLDEGDVGYIGQCRHDTHGERLCVGAVARDADHMVTGQSDTIAEASCDKGVGEPGPDAARLRLLSVLPCRPSRMRH